MNPADLIARLNSLEERALAEQPSRELDALIRCEASKHWEYDLRPAKQPGMVTCRYESGSHGTFIAPRYTSSLDAAMTLPGEAALVVMIALKMCIEAVGDEPAEFTKALPRFVTAAKLRALAAQVRP